MAERNPGSQLADFVGPLAEKMLTKCRTFPPWAMGFDRNRKPVSYSRCGDGTSPCTPSDLAKVLVDDVRSGRLIATAIVTLMDAAPEPGQRLRKVIGIQIEVPDQVVLVMCRPYRRKLFGGYRFDPIFSGQAPFAPPATSAPIT